MGKRRQQRLKTVIPVRVSGIDQSGKPFAELVHTLDISYAGARLGGVSAALVIGSQVAVQCRLHKSKFTVSWVGQAASTYKKQIGLRNLEPTRDLFGAKLKNEMIVDDFVASAEPPAHDPKPAAPAAKSASSSMAGRLQAVTTELDAMDRLMQSGTVNPQVLSEFRDAISRVRTTAWALQQWTDLEQGQKNPNAVLSYLNAERIAVAIRLCESLHHDLHKTDLSHQKEQLQVLLGAVEKLFTRLAAMDLSVLEANQQELQAKKPRSAERA